MRYVAILGGVCTLAGLSWYAYVVHATWPWVLIHWPLWVMIGVLAWPLWRRFQDWREMHRDRAPARVG